MTQTIEQLQSRIAELEAENKELKASIDLLGIVARKKIEANIGKRAVQQYKDEVMKLAGEPVAWISAGGDVSHSRVFMELNGFSFDPLFTSDQVIQAVHKAELAATARLEAKVERLKARVKEQSKAYLQADEHWKDRYCEVTEQLAAHQLHAKQLRKALESCFEKMRQMCLNGEWYDPDKAIDLAWNALALPRDTSALDAYVAEKVKAARSIDEKQIAYLFEERLTLTRQRDLAVEALEKANEGMKAELSDNWTCSSYHPKLFAGEKAIDEALSTIKGSEKL